ncbi:MAG: hypothetical protein LQ338_002511 [Usnochroma carphineum]|nr:MAG: hypothetical protein LQ338_002511 [Usnochroma carphineum]
MPIQLPSWSQTKTTSKQGFDKVYNLVDKLGAPINKLSNKIGSEAFWPTTLDIESDKAARILRSFCKDGFYVEEPDAHIPAEGQPRGKVKVVKKIPSEVIRKAKGLAIFTTMRTGLWVSGAGGSGILVGRTPNGDWSPPSGIMLHTAGLGFLVGVDIYDCVVVINTEKAMEAFTKIRCTLGGEVSAVAGPVGAGAILETEVHKRQAPVWTYLKSRGFYAGVQVDGTVIIERTDENERFYGERIKVADILAGKARHPPYEIRTLMATIKAAQGDRVDENALPSAEPTPGDMELEKPEEPDGFGLPKEDDPDPFGVRALEAEGMEIREAGTRSRPSLDAFVYKPAPSSPIYNSFRRHSLDSASRRNSKRDSSRSIASIDRGTQTDAIATSTNVESPLSHSPLEEMTEKQEEEEGLTDGLGISNAAEQHSKLVPVVQQAAPQPVISRARLVTIPKRIPPALPPRSPYRQSPRVINAEPSPPSAPSVPSESQHADKATDPLSPPPQSSEFANIPLDDREPDNASPRQDLSQVLHNVHPPAPSTQPSSLKSAGLDSASVSGSEYSRAQSTPAQTPGLEAETDGMVHTPITMEDQEATPVKASTEHDLRIGSIEMQREESQTSEKKDDEFHSIPSTPIESTGRSYREGWTARP